MDGAPLEDRRPSSPPISSAPTTPTATPTFAITANVDATSSAAKYARYIHQCMCSPPSATLLGALNCSEELATIPGLMPALINNHLPCSTATDKGHMRRHTSNTPSTRNVQDDIVNAQAKVNRMFPQHELCAMQDVFCTCQCHHGHNVHRHHWCLPGLIVQKYAIYLCCICL
jgi:hypothetical protein